MDTSKAEKKDFLKVGKSVSQMVVYLVVLLVAAMVV
jgi:hypothetical protein